MVRRDEQRIERIERIRVGAKDLPRIARNTRNLLLRETPTDGTDWYRWLGCAEMNNGLNRLNGLYSSGGILPPPRPSYIRAIRAIRGRNILDVRGRPQNTLNTRKTIAERWTTTNYANNTNFVCLPTSVNICAICGRLFSTRGPVSSVRSVGISFLPQISLCTDISVHRT